jgi:hypothetical protein
MLDQRDLTHVGATESELAQVWGYIREFEVGMSKNVLKKNL